MTAKSEKIDYNPFGEEKKECEDEEKKDEKKQMIHLRDPAIKYSTRVTFLMEMLSNSIFSNFFHNIWLRMLQHRERRN